MPRYQVTIAAETLPELVGALTEAASLLQAGDAGAGVSPMAAREPDGPALVFYEGEEIPLPTPAPDYAAAGLTDFQAMRVRAAQAEMQIPPMPAPPGTPVAAQQALQRVQAPAGQIPFCPIHMAEMEWKGGALSKSGKNLPLWSCKVRNCREAVWPPRA